VSKALVVDDSRALRMILARTVRQLGYEVEEAENGVRALQILNSQPNDWALALVDWNMPEMNGMDLLQRLRSDTRFRSTALVMVTTETEVDHMSAALQAGANEYIMKPFTPDILREKLALIGIGC
jgi:two-component system chemotaxis response regulator CheY